MPIFEYQCRRCDQQFEALIRNGESTACPSCQAIELDKLFSAPAAHVGSDHALPVTSACPPSDAPPCHPNCCRLQ